MRWRVKLAQIIAFLMIGAALNVLVAWGFAAFHPRIIYGPGRDPIDGVFHWNGSGSGWSIMYLPEWGTAHLRGYDAQRIKASTRRTLVEDELPSWSRFRSPARGAADGSSLPIWTEMARGWPLYSMSSRVEEDTVTGQRRVYDAIRLPFGAPECQLYLGAESFLPLYVIWPGFLVNTVLYALASWGVVVGMVVIRSRRRIKRGLCPACAYPVGASEVCSECGGRVRRG